LLFSTFSHSESVMQSFYSLRDVWLLCVVVASVGLPFMIHKVCLLAMKFCMPGSVLLGTSGAQGVELGTLLPWCAKLLPADLPVLRCSL
jgi:hypothetical protein